MVAERKGPAVQSNRRRITWLLGLSGLGLGAALGSSHPVLAQTAPSSASLGWHDGDRWRPLSLVPDKVADFSPSRISRTSIIEAGQPDALRSAVLRDEGGRLRALPGGLIVRVRPGLSAEQVREQFMQSGLKPSRPIGEDQWLIESPVGLESLRRANELHASGRFASVQPNWWVERRLR
jgi:hypothetical protein